MTPDSKDSANQEFLRNLYKSDLFVCAKELCGFSEANWRTHGDMIQALESDDERKLIVMPRGTFKSSIGVVAYTVWRLINDPNLRILINSEVYTNSKNWIREISGVFKSKKFVDVFGDWEGSPWSDGEIIVKARTKNFKESSVVAGGVGTIKTGQHYDLILNDDLNSEKNSDTSEGRQKVIRFYRMQFSLLEPGKTMIVIGTRYAVDDVIGHIMEHEIDQGLIK